MKKLLIVLSLICSAILVVGAQDGFAWPTYEGGCINCHGAGFAALNNHSIHAGQACTVCHPGAAGAIPIPSSNCIVCHPPGNPGLCPLIDVPTHVGIKNTCLACHTECAPPVEQDCFDELDNDGDGFFDCADSDCAGATGPAVTCGVGACANTGQFICENGQSVNTCVPLPAGMEQFGEGNTCNDGIDNDCDGLTDIADPGCAPPSVEQDCFDQQDNDGDGVTDCADPDCANAQDGSCDTGLPGICAAGTVQCVNGAAACIQDNFPVPEICGDQLDNDCDGFIDAADPDCEAPPCVDNAECGTPEFCAKAPGDCNGIGQCEIKPIACPDIYDPVCGCDGKTYDNACYANQAGVNIDYAGPCVTPEIPVNVDIKPGSCPNPINLKAQGVLPFAIMGSVDFDVTQIDPASIRLSREGTPDEVAPIRWSYYDAGIPNEDFDRMLCNCVGAYYDGIIDLALKFDAQHVIKALKLAEVLDQTIPLTITGKLYDKFGGMPIKGEDCVRVSKK